MLCQQVIHSSMPQDRCSCSKSSYHHTSHFWYEALARKWHTTSENAMIFRALIQSYFYNIVLHPEFNQYFWLSPLCKFGSHWLFQPWKTCRHSVTKGSPDLKKYRYTVFWKHVSIWTIVVCSTRDKLNFLKILSFWKKNLSFPVSHTAYEQVLSFFLFSVTLLRASKI